MNSSIPNGFEIKTYHATWKDMWNFSQFMHRVERECEKECAAKIVPPPGFDPKSREINPTTVLKRVVKLSAESMSIKNDTAFELSYENGQTMKYEKFKRQALQNESKLHGLTEAEIEDRAWQQLEQGSLNALYAINNEFTLFNDQCRFGNLSKFSTRESIIHQKNMKQLEGIHTPYVYIGSWPSNFALHLEECNLNAINFLHRGMKKIWYIIPIAENDKLEKLAREFGKVISTTCKNFIRHKSLMIAPTVLKKYGIKFSRVTQNPGEYIVTFSGGYHAGFNCGWNEAEAINFGTSRWLENVEKFKPCACVFAKEMRAVANELRPIYKNPGNFNKTLKCNNCDKFFSRQRYLNQHVNECKSKNIRFNCNKCHKTFAHRRNVTRHLKTCHGTSVVKFVCPTCGGKFTRRGDLRTHHFLIHTTKVDIAKISKINDTTSKTKLSTRKNKNLAKLQCSLCNTTLTGTSNFNRHMKNQH